MLSGYEIPLQAILEELIHRRSTMGTNLLDTRREIDKEEEAGPRCKTPPQWWLGTTTTICIPIPLSRIDLLIIEIF
jgi:hypothetical protein